jgi:tRNA-uridine 2-sulfurtransferase
VRVLVAMSGGVDSSVAASVLVDAGHDVVGATLKLWGGPSDSGCCSVADVDDARRVADRLGVEHHVFGFTDDFAGSVVAPYVAAHAAGRTPNPCIECNRHIKFGRLLERARRLGFDALATGHHARVEQCGPSDNRWRLLRGADRAKDQSYVLSMLSQSELADVVLPVGSMTKTEVRAQAARRGLRTAEKPDSQEVCFIPAAATGRRSFLEDRLPLHEGEIVEARSGQVVGTVPAVELVTVGQRRGLGVGRDGRRRYALAVDTHARRVLVGEADEARTVRVRVGPPTWVGRPLVEGSRAVAQTSAHGQTVGCTWSGREVVFDRAHALVAPGQTVALYDEDDPDAVVGSAVAVA